MFFPLNYFPATYFPAGLFDPLGASSGISVQGFQYARHTAIPHTYQGPWTLAVAQDMALYPGSGDDISGLVVTVTPEGVSTTDTVVTATGLPNPLPPPFDESQSVLTLTGSVDGVVRGIVLFPELQDGGAAAEEAASLAILAADSDIAVGPALVSLLPVSSILTQGSDGVIHVLLTGRGTDGLPLDLTGMSASMAITRTTPTDADFAAADVLVRTAAPAGTYARLAVGASAGRVLSRGSYFVTMRLTLGTETRLLTTPGTLRVTS